MSREVPALPALRPSFKKNRLLPVANTMRTLHDNRKPHDSVQVLFADLQPQIVARSKTNPPDALTRSAVVLAQVARLLHLPMHLSVVPEGGQRPELIPELAQETDGVAQYLRVLASPFLDEATRAAIAATGRQHLVIAGFATE